MAKKAAKKAAPKAPGAAAAAAAPSAELEALKKRLEALEKENAELKKEEEKPNPGAKFKDKFTARLEITGGNKTKVKTKGFDTLEEALGEARLMGQRGRYGICQKRFIEVYEGTECIQKYTRYTFA